MLCNFTLRLRHGREIAQPYRFWGLLGFPPRSDGMMAQAHCVGTGGETFGSQSIANVSGSGNVAGASQFDLWAFNCPAGSTGASAKIGKISGAAGSIVLHLTKNNANNNGNPTDNAVETADSTANAGSVCVADSTGLSQIIPTSSNPSPLITRSGGAGQYTAVVSKDASASMNYAMEFHCVGTAGDLPTAPSTNGEIDRIANH
jgi:hypothetical protein